MTAASTQNTAKATPRDKLGQLFAGLYPGAAQCPPADAGRLAGVLAAQDPAAEDIAAGAARRLEQPLDARQTGILNLAQAVLAEFYAQPVFDPALGRSLLSASGALLAEALPADGWLLRRDHPAGRLLLHLADVARGWWPELPEAAEQQQLMQGWLNELADNDAADVANRVARWLEQQRARREKIVARVQQSESGAMRLRHARQLVARTLNNQLRDRPLPDFMVAAMDAWVSAFQWVLLQEGEQGPLWVRLSRSFALLVWSLQPAAAEANTREKLNRVVAELKQDLREVLSVAVADDQVREQLLEDIQVAHFCQQQGRELNWLDAPPVEGGSALDEAGASVSGDLLDEVNAVSPGDWFLLTATGQRLELLLKQDELQQLLFINQRGTREMVLSFEEFAWQFSTAKMSSLVAPTPLHDWVVSRLDGLAEKYRQAQRSRAQRAREQQLSEAKQREEREASWRKARAEAERLEAQREAAPAEPPAEPSRQEAAAAIHGATDEQRRKRARLLVSGLTMGAWLDFHEGDNAVRRKLAVVLPSSGKYIFVDGVGGEKYQLARQELIQGIAEGNVTVVRKDARFDDALSRIMDSNTA